MNYQVAETNLEDLDSEVRFGQLSGEDYANLRLGVHREMYEEEADWLDRGILWYKIATYVLGVAGGMLSFLSLEVPPPAAASPRPLAAAAAAAAQGDPPLLGEVRRGI